MIGKVHGTLSICLKEICPITNEEFLLHLKKSKETVGC